jgi:hypothetical protein
MAADYVPRRAAELVSEALSDTRVVIISGLALTGRLADGWIPFLRFAAPDRIPEMLQAGPLRSRVRGRLRPELAEVVGHVGVDSVERHDQVVGDALV